LTPPPPNSLAEALAKYEIDLPQEQAERLDRYRALLWDWNERINLTRHTDFDKFVARDVVDTQALAQFIDQGHEVLDVGTGGGVPAVILAILRPDLEVSACDTVGKKARAVEQMVEELGLPVAVAHARVEEMLEMMRYDTLVGRAVAPLEKIVTWLEPYRASFDQLLLIKGRRWLEERDTARHKGLMKPWELRRLLSYPTPGTEAESVVLKLWASEEA